MFNYILIYLLIFSAGSGDIDDRFSYSLLCTQVLVSKESKEALIIFTSQIEGTQDSHDSTAISFSLRKFYSHHPLVAGEEKRLQHNDKLKNKFMRQFKNSIKKLKKSR